MTPQAAPIMWAGTQRRPTRHARSLVFDTACSCRHMNGIGNTTYNTTPLPRAATYLSEELGDSSIKVIRPIPMGYPLGMGIYARSCRTLGTLLRIYYSIDTRWALRGLPPYAKL